MPQRWGRSASQEGRHARPEQQPQPFRHQARLHVRQFFQRRGRGWAWFRNDSRAVHFLCTLFLLFFHQLHIRSSGIRSQRSETRGLEHLLWFLQEETGVATDTGLAGMDSSGESGAEGWPLVVGSGPKLVCAGGRRPSLGEPDGEGGDGVQAPSAG